jgi:hypothetical protein
VLKILNVNSAPLNLIYNCKSRDKTPLRLGQFR